MGMLIKSLLEKCRATYLSMLVLLQLLDFLANLLIFRKKERKKEELLILMCVKGKEK
jgi:hypothetical protein